MYREHNTRIDNTAAQKNIQETKEGGGKMPCCSRHRDSRGSPERPPLSQVHVNTAAAAAARHHFVFQVTISYDLFFYFLIAALPLLQIHFQSSIF